MRNEQTMQIKIHLYTSFKEVQKIKRSKEPNFTSKLFA